MEVTSTNKDEENVTEKISTEDNAVKEIEPENFENENEKNPVEENFNVNNSIDYDDDDSGDDFAVITKTSGANDSSPAKTMFSIKTISNSQLQNNYKLSKTAVDLDHPGNINGVPTIDYDLSKLVDEYKPWKKPGADVSDYFNYGFIEETWLRYCEKQKTLRLSQENSALKTLSGLQNFGYPLSGSHIHLGFNRSNHKSSKGGLIDVIGGQQGDYKMKHNDIGMNVVNKISTIPVQTGNVNVNGPNQAGNNYISGLANQAINNNLLNPIMSAAMAMGILPGAGAVQVLATQPNAPIDAKMSQFNSIDGGVRGNHGFNNNGGPGPNQPPWGPQASYDRSNSVDTMYSHEDYDRKAFLKSDRGNRRGEHEETRRYKSRERRERSSERRRRSRSRSRDRAHDSKHSRKRNRSPDEARRHRKHSRERHSSGDSERKHRRHRSNKRHRQSRSRSYEARKERHQRRHKSPGADSGKYKAQTGSYKDDAENRSADKNESSNENLKRELDYPNAD